MMKEKLHIVKIGGNVIDDEELIGECLSAFHSLTDARILVHGGGKAGSRMLKALDIPVKYIDGRRITDEATMKVVTMVYAGEINKNIVALLQARGCNAIGLSGCDGNIIQAEKREVKDIDYGFAGDIVKINTDLIQSLLKIDLTPVINPITHNLKGQLLNTNADTIAAALGEALAGSYEVSIHYCFEYNGVLKDIKDPESIIAHIDESLFRSLKETGEISSGMIPKLSNAFNGLKKGVAAVTIGNHRHFIQQDTYTKIHL